MLHQSPSGLKSELFYVNHASRRRDLIYRIHTGTTLHSWPENPNNLAEKSCRWWFNCRLPVLCLDAVDKSFFGFSRFCWLGDLGAPLRQPFAGKLRWSQCATPPLGQLFRDQFSSSKFWPLSTYSDIFIAIVPLLDTLKTNWHQLTSHFLSLANLCASKTVL